MISCTTCAQKEILWYSPNSRVCVCTHEYVRSIASDGAESVAADGAESVASDDTESVCVPCAAGEYFREQESACARCLKGRYKNDTEIRPCDRCPNFSSTISTGATNLYNCRCNPETTGPDGGPCTPCVVGKYKSAFGEAKYSCGMGTYSLSNSDECCTLCEAGKYQDELEALVCKNSPLNTEGMPGANTLWDCLCRKGAFQACLRAFHMYILCVCAYICMCICVQTCIYVYVCMCVCICTSMRFYTCVCVYIFVHRLWVLVAVPQRVDGVMHAHVFSCAYVCEYICMWVYIYVHFFAVSVTCTLQVFWALVHWQACMLHRNVCTPTYTSMTHSLQVVHIFICIYVCICMHMHMDAYVRL